jgi:L-seryl-tRNA(Ser) seleniumtransferase
MEQDAKQNLLKQIPPMTQLLKVPAVAKWLASNSHNLVTNCLRDATAEARRNFLESMESGTDGASLISPERIVALAEERLVRATAPRLREAINATGIILHTGLGRAVFPEAVVDSTIPALKGYSNLAVDRESGERIERDELAQPILTELTGAEAATVVNNNAAATLLVLAALAAGKEVLVSRGQLIEIGGSFRLPDVMQQSGARLVEVGTTNRTHLQDYEKAITPETAAILSVHPSNYRVVGFTTEPSLSELVEVAHRRGILMIDDLGAGALVDLEQFGLPHEPTVGESIRAGADVVLFSGDKLIGASQSGVIVGRKELIQRLRKHPLMRALRIDKTCLLILERTLHLFRQPAVLPRQHPAYRMICTPMAVLQARAATLRELLARTLPGLRTSVVEAEAYLGSGSLPTQNIPSIVVTLASNRTSASELSRRLRLDEGCIFARIEADQVCLDMRTLTDHQVPVIASALRRIAG